MAKVTLRPEIMSISGKVGKVMFKTFKNGEVRMYQAPSYERKKPFSEKELQAKELFRRRAKRVAELQSAGIPKQMAWKAAKREIF